MYRRRYFDKTIKSLLHFDFPYNYENNSGLRDEVSSEIWTPYMLRFAGDVIFPDTQKFGYRCAYLASSSSYLDCSNNTGIWTIEADKKYELSFFLRTLDVSQSDIFSFWEGDNKKLSLALNSSGYLSITADDNTTSTKSIVINTWYHVLFRISGGLASLFIDGSNFLTVPAVSINTTKFRFGSFLGMIDEFLFRHDAGSSVIIPAEPEKGSIDIASVGGFGSKKNTTHTFSSPRYMNTCGMIDPSLSSGTHFSVKGWKLGFEKINAGDEIFAHVVLPKGTSHEFTGCYAFRKITSINGNNFIIDKPILDEFEFDAIKKDYYIQIITVPNFAKLVVNADLSPYPFDINYGGGVIIFRASNSVTINKRLLTSGLGPERIDLLQMCHPELIDRFIINKGGGVFIVAKELHAGNNARIGGDWAGNLTPADFSHGGSGYGGASSFEAGKVGYGGNGGSTGYIYAYPGVQGKDPGGNSQNSAKYTGGGAPGGNAGGVDDKIGVSGASVVIVAEKLDLDDAALSTGGKMGVVLSTDTGKGERNSPVITFATGGGGTGFAYISAKEFLS